MRYIWVSTPDTCICIFCRGSDVPVHLPSLARAFAAHILKIEK